MAEDGLARRHRPGGKEAYTFLAGSKGSLDAIAELSRAYGKEVRQRPGVLPLVSLEVDAYQHHDRTIGRVKCQFSTSSNMSTGSASSAARRRA